MDPQEVKALGPLCMCLSYLQGDPMQWNLLFMYLLFRIYR